MHNKIKPSILKKHTATHVAVLSYSSNDSNRERILSCIVEQDINISERAELIGVSQSAVSHHMRRLEQVRLVKSRRDEKEIFYSMYDPYIIEFFK